MTKFTTRLLSSLCLFAISVSAYAWDKGIYLTQYMMENPQKLDYFITQAKATGLNTFVIDHAFAARAFYYSLLHRSLLLDAAFLFSSF